MDLSEVATSIDIAISFTVGAFLPAVVALITKKATSSSFKSGVLLVLSVVSATLVQLIAVDVVTVSTAINGFVATFGAAVVSHLGALKPLHITGSEGRIQERVRGGLGPISTPEEDDSDGEIDEPEVNPVEPVADEAGAEVIDETDLEEEVIVDLSEDDFPADDLKDIGGEETAGQ